jgi:hypothetical protein
MKKTSLYLLIVVFFTLTQSCKQDAKPASQASSTKNESTPVVPYEPLPGTEGADVYTLTQGKVKWIASKATGAKHNGTVNVKEATFHVKDGRVIAINAALDMNTIAVEDLTDPGENRDFIDHMKSSEFFNVAKYPTASFTITDNLKNVNLPDYPNVFIGPLTLCGIAKEAKIPAKTNISGGVLKVTTPGFAVNRTDYGIKFGSGIIGTAKDKMIDDFILLNLELEAKKQ